jgi:hypothetical protein
MATEPSERPLQFIQRVKIPPDVERAHYSEPCFKCGARGACRHRPAELGRRP